MQHNRSPILCDHPVETGCRIETDVDTPQRGRRESITTQRLTPPPFSSYSWPPSSRHAQLICNGPPAIHQSATISRKRAVRLDPCLNISLPRSWLETRSKFTRGLVDHPLDPLNQSKQAINMTLHDHPLVATPAHSLDRPSTHPPTHYSPTAHSLTHSLTHSRSNLPLLRHTK